MPRTRSLFLYLLVPFALVLAGCPKRPTSPGAPATSSTAPTPSDNSERRQKMAEAARAGIFHFGNGAEPQDIDPHTITGVTEHKILMALSEGFVSEDPRDLHPIPATADKWNVSDDGLTYTFHIRESARWSNGDPVTTEDFYLSYKRILTSALGSEYAYMIYDHVENARDYYDGRITDFSKVGFKILDPQTLQVRLKAPTPYLLKMIASHYSWWPVPVKVVAKFGGMKTKGTAWTRPENFVGNGPFRLKEWRQNEVLVVEKSPTYWDRERVRLNEICFHPVTAENTEESMFRTGQLHRTGTLRSSKIDVYRRQDPGALRIEPYLGVYFYRFNVERPPINNVKVRRALALAINREAIVRNVTKGGQIPAYNFTPHDFPGYKPRARLEGTVDDARRLLAEAGYPEGKGFPALELLYNTSESHKDIAEAIQEMWRTTLGIDVKLVNQEWKVYLDNQHARNFQVERAGWIADYLDPNTFPEIFVTNGGNNDTGWSNEEYDKLYEQSLHAKDDATRFAIYQRMDQILVDEMPIMPIYHYTRVYLLDPSVHGWFTTPLDNHPYKDIWLEEPK